MNSPDPCTKWSTLTISEMEKIYMGLNLRNVLDAEYDSRKCRIDKLGMKQLKKECKSRSIAFKAGEKKVSK